MKFIPHDYQKYAIDYIESHSVSAILLDMGLGKTVITLTAINNLLFERFQVKKVLVIGPLRVAKVSWPEEIEKWEHLKGLRYSVAIGPEHERRSALMRDADIYIINRENVQWLVEKSGLEFDFDMVVIDELSSFKSWDSRRFRSLMKVRPKVRRIVGLTGTPSSNGLMDLFAEFRLLDMGERLGRFIGRYRDMYFLPDKRNGMVIYSYKPKPDAENQIYEKISDITISMRAADHLNMPELVTGEVKVAMSAREQKRYRQMKDELVLELDGGEVTAANAASLTSKLCQMSNGAVYADDEQVMEIHQRKLDALEDIVEAANGRPVLVVYWFRHDLGRISRRLEKLKVGFSQISSPESIRKWNDGRIAVGLIHPASAGHGLNLQAGGSHLVWFGLTWSLELYQQTNARLYRQGQKSGTVVIHHIIVRDTIDEKILKALKDKDISQAALIEAVKAEVGRHEEKH